MVDLKVHFTIHQMAVTSKESRHKNLTVKDLKGSTFKNIPLVGTPYITANQDVTKGLYFKYNIGFGKIAEVDFFSKLR